MKPGKFEFNFKILWNSSAKTTNRVAARWCKWRPWLTRMTWRWSVRGRIWTSWWALRRRPSTNIRELFSPFASPVFIWCTGSSTSTSQRSTPKTSLYTIPNNYRYVNVSSIQSIFRNIQIISSVCFKGRMWPISPIYPLKYARI